MYGNDRPIKWKRTSEAFDVETSYSFGPWRLDKQFFADGPSLFDWNLTHVDNDQVNEFFNTKRQATNYVREWATK